MDVTVITPTIPERAELLSQAIASVNNQIEPAVAHLIGVDLERAGPTPVRNRLLKSVDTEWVAFLDDDDILYPQHFRVVSRHLDSADLIYTWCNSEGRDGFNPNSYFDEQRLRGGNYIPITVTLRTSKLREVGGIPNERLEDWALWVKLLDSGARFVCEPTVTWNYRFLGGNRTFS